MFNVAAAGFSETVKELTEEWEHLRKRSIYGLPKLSSEARLRLEQA